MARLVGVVQNISDNTQEFYQGHKSAISAIALHPSREIVATADMSHPPSIHVWSVDSLNCMSYLVGVHEHVVSGLKFSLDGKQLATISTGPIRSLAIYDWRKDAVVSSGHISSAAVGYVLASRCVSHKAHRFYACRCMMQRLAHRTKVQLRLLEISSLNSPSLGVEPSNSEMQF